MFETILIWYDSADSYKGYYLPLIETILFSLGLREKKSV